MSPAADRSSVLGGILVVLVIAAVVAAFLVIGPPSKERRIRLDATRTDDLAAIALAVDLYWSQHKAVPDDLATIGARPGSRLAITDPESNAPYRYVGSNDSSFTLCAHFATDSLIGTSADQENATLYVTPWPMIPRNYRVWQHAAGDQCFKLTAHAKPGP